MYHVIARIHDEEYPLLEPPNDECILIDPVLRLKMGKAGAFTFDIASGHPYRHSVKPFETYIIVLRNGEPFWYGRVIDVSEDFYKTASVTCEGELAYLNDSIVPVYSHAGDIETYVRYMLDVHNANVDDAKKIYCGSIEVTDSNSYMVRASKQYPRVFDELTEKLVDVYGGYLRTRHTADGKIYLDYVFVYGRPNSQVLRLDENILDYESRKGGEFYTRIIPIGDDVGEGENAKPLTIASVNGGKIYLDNDALIAKFGVITGVKEWPDVTIANNLLAKGRAEVLAQELPGAFGLKAVDLSLIDADADALQLGCTTTVISPFHELEAAYLLTAMNINFDEPERDEMLFGDMVTTYTGSSAQAQAEARTKLTIAQQEMIHYTQVEAAAQVKAVARIITGTDGGNIYINAYNNAGDAAAPTAIYVLDDPDKDLAEKVIRLDENGISVSSSGIDGPYTVVLEIGGTGWRINSSVDNLSVINNLDVGGRAGIANLAVSGTTELADLYLTNKWDGKSLSAMISDILARLDNGGL